MATSKPTFPNPPLEVGIPTYPTPLVPDFYTKNGHIILVEKVSAEKGSYNPQPLDGSITYTGRDANKWPSTLYLVAEKPEPTGQFVFRYWANDRTLASQDPWNYGLTYQDEDPDYPIISRQYITPREDYAPVALGTSDPVFGGDAVISKQGTQELPDENPLRSRYILVQRIYETIPGPILTGKQYDDFFQANLDISKQIVVAGSAAPTLPDGVLSYKDDPIDAVKSQRIIVSLPSSGGGVVLPPTRTEYKTGTFSSPLLVFGIDVDSADFTCGDTASIRIKLTPQTRASQSRQTVFKTITSYSYGEPEPGDTDLFAPELKQIAFTGYVVNFDLGGGLCDALRPPSNPYYPAIGPQYGVLAWYCPGDAFSYLFESWNITATTISATEYLSYIGTYKKISWQCEYWKAGIWVAKEIWVKIV